MSVLVTGATGFVPANVVERLLAAGREVVALHHGPLDDALVERVRAAGPGRVTFVRGDTSDGAALRALLAEHRPEGVIQMAAMTPMDAETERGAVRRIVGANVTGALNVLLASAEAGVRRVVFLSSVAVYAPNDGAPIDEAGAVRDDGALYPLTKLSGEQLCRWTTATLGLDVRMVRLGPVYGPWERPTPSRQRMSSVWQAVDLALAGQSLRCNNPTLVREWIHAVDAAEGLLALLDAPTLPHDLYNLTGPPATMDQTLAAVATAVPGTTVAWVNDEDDANVPVPAAQPRGPILSTRLTADTGWTPRYDIAAGVAQYVGWLRASDHV